MEEEQAPAHKGYQKQIKKEDKPVQPRKNAAADYSSPMAKKWPAVIEAVESGKVEAVKGFMEEGFNMNLFRNGMTPLMMAAAKGRTEVAKLLLDSGVNINEKNDDGSTALHKAAAEQPGTPIVELFLESGCAIDAKDNAGKTALMLAEEKKHVQVVQVIRKHQSSLQDDVREWNEFLNSPDGKPYKAGRQLDMLTSYSQLWFIPVLALGGAGLLLGFFFGLVKSLIAGLVCGLLFNGGYFLRIHMLRKYLDRLGGLPELDIHLLREKRRTGERIMPLKKTAQPAALNPVAPQPAGTGISAPPPAPEPLALEPADTGLSATTPPVLEPLALEPTDNVFAPASPPVLEPLALEPADTGFAAATISSPDPLPAPEAPAPALRAASVPARMVDRRSVVLAAAAISFVAVSVFGLAFRDNITKWYYVKKLEQRGMSFSEKAFLDAVAGGDSDLVSLFLKAGIACDAKNEKGQTGLIIAAEKGHAALAGLLIQAAPSLLGQPDTAGMTPLMTAALHGQEKTVRSFIESGAEVNQMIAGREGAATALQAVLDAPDFTGEHLKILRYLLEQGADVKARNAAGRSPLLLAALHGRTDAARLLREKGADVNEADNSGANALHLAVLIGNAEFTTFLADQGVNLNAPALDGRTELMDAARNGHPAACQVLLDKGAEIDARTAQGSTALTDASVAGDAEIVKLLLERGADPSTGTLPDPFLTLAGKTVAVSAKMKNIHAVLKRIAEAATQDGYTLTFDSVPDQKAAVNANAAWNQVLIRAAGKSHLFVVVKEKQVVVLPWDPSRRKRGAN